MNWRDYTSLTAIGFVVVVMAGIIGGLPAAQLSDWRPATILIAILGFIIFFTISPSVAPTGKSESLTAALLGVLALILTFVGMIISNQILFLVLCANLVVLWSVVTYYHLSVRREHARR